jgi:uncharacterized membrane protein
MKMNGKRVFLAVAMVFVTLAVSSPRLWGADDKDKDKKSEFIQYDFSKPEVVFKDSMAESVTGLGVDPAMLYQVLRSGQFVIVNDKPNNPKIPWVTTEGALINAPADVVYGVIRKVEDYPTFMPQTSGASRKAINPDIDHVFYDLTIQIFSALKVKVPYSVYHWYRKPYRVDWTMASGEFKANLGAYEVVPVPNEPNRSMLFYTSYSLPRNDTVVKLFNKIPNLDMMINLSAGTLVVEAMKKQAEGLHKKNGGKTDAPAALEFQTLIDGQPEMLAKLASKGKLVVLEYGKPRYYTGVIAAKKPREAVFDAVADFEGMASISKNLYMNILDRKDNTVRIKVRTVINLVIDFDTTYVMKDTLKKPERIDWVGEPGGGIKGVAGSWQFKSLGADKTLAFNRNTSDLPSQGFAMRKILEIEPSFEQAIQASQTILVISDMKRFAEASPEERKKMAVKK